MNQETALNRESSESRPGLYMSLELSKERWRLAFTIGLGQKVRERTLQVADLGRLSEEVERARRRFGVGADAPVRSFDEADREGFWVHRWLLRQGIDNVVADSSSILVERRARKAKSDGIDVRKLLGMLCRFHNGER